MQHITTATTTRNSPYTGFRKVKVKGTVPLPGNPFGEMPSLDVESFIRQEVEACLNACPWYRARSCGVKEAAQLLKVKEDTIRNWILAGKLFASNIGRMYIIRLIDIENMLNRYQVVVPLYDKRFKKNRKQLIDV